MPLTVVYITEVCNGEVNKNWGSVRPLLKPGEPAAAAELPSPILRSTHNYIGMAAALPSPILRSTIGVVAAELPSPILRSTHNIGMAAAEFPSPILRSTHNIGMAAKASDWDRNALLTGDLKQRI